jgi:Flp pilus assembly protein TadD/tRNA A-37 threonylcarbamoyl transferase component Bud32
MERALGVSTRMSSEAMPVNPICSQCGSERPSNAPTGLCPQCLLRLGLGPNLGLSDGVRAAGPPALSAIRGAVGRQPSHCPAAETGPHPAPGVLTALNETIGPIPRVLLRDGSADDPRPVRPRSDEMPDLAGELIRYQLLGEIARGGMGAVLKGRDVDLGRDLAIKVLLEKHRDHPEMVRRFVEEAQIGGQLQHPGIVPVHELGRFPDGRLFIAMKLVKGRTLAALLEARKEPAEDRSRFLSVFEQVCQTVAYAHARGVVHRDLKPSNVMVGSFGEVQVMDWGLAKVLEDGGIADEGKARRAVNDSSAVRTLRTGSNAGESRAGSVLGTPGYMSPEQARGIQDTLDERADVFGLGSILCEILTGQPAYAAATSAELYRKAERADLAEALERLDGCGADAELIALARSCLAAAPRDRPRDAGMVAAGLTAYLAGVDHRLRSAGLAQAKAEARAAEERKRRILTVGLAASILTTGLLAVAGWAWVSRDRAGRVASTILAVKDALDEAGRKRDEARSAPGVAAARWVEAIEAARRAEALSARGEGGVELHDRVRTALAEIVRERNASEAADKDRRMVERLVEIHDDLGVHLDVARAEAEYAAAFRDYGVDVEALSPREAGARLAASSAAAELAGALDQWLFIRRGQKPPNIPGEQHLLAVAKAADPDPWRNRLRDSLDPRFMRRGGTLDDLHRLAASADPDRLPEASVTRLAYALAGLKDTKTAISLLRRAQRSHPGDFWLNMDLAGILARTDQPEEAIRFYSVAVSVRPRSGLALNDLGTVLHDTGRLEDAAGTFRQACRLQPDYAMPRVCLGSVLLDLGQSAEAEAQFREAEALQPDDFRIRDQIARNLMRRGHWGSATAELREAVRRQPWNPFAQDRLGLALLDGGRIDEAIRSIREAVRLDPRFPPFRDNLGRALLAKGEFDEALECLRRPHRGGPAEKDRPTPSHALVREAERMVALEARLPALLRGRDKPADASEAAEFARLCHSKQLHATAARLWGEAFTAQPALAEDITAELRYRAARAAAMSGCGQGKDDPPPAADARERLRRQALDWLEAELAAYSRLLQHGDPRERAAIPRRLGRWRVDRALEGLRDEPGLSALPEHERSSYRALWSNAEALREQFIRSGLAGTSASPPPHAPPPDNRPRTRS